MSRSNGADRLVRTAGLPAVRLGFPFAVIVCSFVVLACNGGEGDKPDGLAGASDPSAVIDATSARSPAAGRTLNPAPPATRPPPIAGSAVLSIDAAADTPAVDAAATHAVGSEFAIAITLDALEEPAAGFQLDLSWGVGVAAFVSFQNTATEAFPTCSRTLSTENSVSGYCLRTEGEVPYTGTLAQVRLRCVAAGETMITLRPPGPQVIGTKIESTPGRNVVHRLTLGQATIICE
jgi:hypothetical protein